MSLVFPLPMKDIILQQLVDTPSLSFALDVECRDRSDDFLKQLMEMDVADLKSDGSAGRNQG